MNKAKNMTTGAGYLLRREDYKRESRKWIDSNLNRSRREKKKRLR